MALHRSPIPLLATAVVALLVSAPRGLGQFDSLDEYPSFRFGSGLPGGGWGIYPDSTVGFGGAMLLNSPVAYTPSRYSGVLGLSVGQLTDDFEFELSGRDVNSTGVLGLGLGSPGRGLFTVAEATAISGEWLWNFQHELMPERGSRPALAIGVQDWGNLRPDHTARLRANEGRSFYITSTKQFGSDDHPVYATAGIGNARFKGAFGGLTYRATPRLVGFGEYDGLGFNSGLGVSLLSHPQRRKGSLTFMGSVVDIFGVASPTWGLTYTHDSWSGPKPRFAARGHDQGSIWRTVGALPLPEPAAPAPSEMPPPPVPLAGERIEAPALAGMGLRGDVWRQEDDVVTVRVVVGEGVSPLVAMGTALVVGWREAPQASRVNAAVFSEDRLTLQVGINRQAYPRVLYTRLTDAQRQAVDALLRGSGLGPIPPAAEEPPA